MTHTEVPPPIEPAVRATRPVAASAVAPTASPTGMFSRGTDHEQVVFCQDRSTGLKAVIAVHSTALGPALGGTRFYPYASEDEAVADVLNLARGMTYKAALAGLDLGGGKAVIIGDPRELKTEALLRAYGRFVQSLGGRYITAADVGSYVADMDVVAQECDFVTGRSVELGGAGDSAVLTAYGVYHGMRAGAERAWGVPSVRGRRVGVAGVGKVGHHLVRHLVEAGAEVVVTDVSEVAVNRIHREHPQVAVATDTAALVRDEIDVYAPCALGGALDEETVAVLRAGVVCGAANNQLSRPGIEQALAERGIVYAPDYVVNAGGLIQVADEIGGFDFARAQRRAAGIFDTTRRVFEQAAEQGVAPSRAADRLAEERIAGAGRAGRIWLSPSGAAHRRATHGDGFDRERDVSADRASEPVEQVP